jgi:hypothetical protein
MKFESKKLAILQFFQIAKKIVINNNESINIKSDRYWTDYQKL